MSNEPSHASRTLVDRIRAHDHYLDGYSGREVNDYDLSEIEAAALIDAALAAEYMRGLTEASGACPTCGATKAEQCHCGEIDEVEL